MGFQNALTAVNRETIHMKAPVHVFKEEEEKFNDDSEDQNEKKDQIIESDKKQVGSKFIIWSVIQRKISKPASNVYSPCMGQ